MSYFWIFALTVVGAGFGSFCGITLARRHYRKRDAAEHDRQMADWDAKIDKLTLMTRNVPRLFSPN